MKRVVYLAMLLLLITLPFILGVDFFIHRTLNLFGRYHIIFNAFLWLIFLMFFDRIKIFLLKLTDRMFFSAEYNYEDIVNELSYRLHEIDDVENLAAEVSDILHSALKVTSLGLFIIDRSSPGYNNIIYEIEEVRSSIDFSHPIIERLKSEKKNWIYLRELAEEDTAEARLIYSLMQDLKATLIISSVYNNIVMGFISIGEKISGAAFQNPDINLISYAVNQSMLVVSRLYEIEDKARINAEKVVQDKHQMALEEKNVLLHMQNDNLEKANDRIRKQETMLVRQERLAAMADVVAGVAHEINTPLMAITLGMNYMCDYINQSRDYLDMARLQTDPRLLTQYNDFDEYSQLIYGSLDSIRNHISNIKSFIKFQEKTDVQFDINREIETTLSVLQFKLPSHVSVAVDLAADLPGLQGNAADINQVLMNIIVNSMEAIPSPLAGLITIKTYQEGNFVVVEIADNGIGIAADSLDKLFIDKFSTKKPSGIGLGLTLCKEIIDQHKGTIALNSKINQGSNCVLRIPLRLAAS